MDSRSPDTRDLSRREFLNFAGASALGLALRKPIEAFANITERPGLETKTAKYYSFYEFHDIGISLNEVKQINNLDTFFSELYMDSQTSNDLTAYGLMNLSTRIGISSLSHSPEAGEKKRLFPDNYLDYFATNNISMAIEGSTLGSFNGTLDNAIKDIEIVTSNVILLKESLRTLYKTFIKKEKSKGPAIRASTALGYWLWAMSPYLTTEALYAKETPNTENTEKDVLEIIHRFSLNLHPEYLTIALRNVLMARRLQTIGQTLFDERQEKPKIAFRAGKNHFGIERFLSLGDEQTIHTLDIYPDWVLKSMIMENDKTDNSFEAKIDTLCSFSLVSTRDVTKRRITDNKLKAYLTNRFSVK